MFCLFLFSSRDNDGAAKANTGEWEGPGETSRDVAIDTENPRITRRGEEDLREVHKVARFVFLGRFRENPDLICHWKASPFPLELLQIMIIPNLEPKQCPSVCLPSP